MVCSEIGLCSMVDLFFRAGVPLVCLFFRLCRLDVGDDLVGEWKILSMFNF